ncbi:MAG: iron-siderophore ABC transporter substrate-binding protein [Cyanobacteria bacterium J06649_4]
MRICRFLSRFLALPLASALLIIACQERSLEPQRPLDAGCRLQQHALGEVCVPKAPQAIISLDETTFADAIALDLLPVGTATYGEGALSYLRDYRAQTELLGLSEQPNLEKMLPLNPDVIIGQDYIGESIFGQLSQIAPTALGKWEGYSAWRKYFDFVARIVDREDKAKTVWADYTRHIDSFKSVMPPHLANQIVTSLYVYSGAMTMDTEASFAGSILADIGLRQSNFGSPDDPNESRVSLSEETLPNLDADILFINVYDAESEALLAEWERKPLWQQLKAVKASQVYLVDANIWRAGNPIAAHLVIDDLFRLLLQQSP